MSCVSSTLGRNQNPASGHAKICRRMGSISSRFCLGGCKALSKLVKVELIFSNSEARFVRCRLGLLWRRAWGGGRGSFQRPTLMVPLTHLLALAGLFKFSQASRFSAKDGSLRTIRQNFTPADGNVFANNGTFGSEDRLNGRMMLNGKGLAGHVITKDGKNSPSL